MVAPGKDLTTTWWPTFLPSLHPCICFIIESSSKTAVNDLSALLEGVESFTESSCLRGSKRFWWLTCWGGSQGFGFFFLWPPEIFYNRDLFSSLNWLELDISLLSDKFIKSFVTICIAVLKESLSSVSFFTVSVSSFNLVFKIHLGLYPSLWPSQNIFSNIQEEDGRMPLKKSWRLLASWSGSTTDDW